MISSRSSVMLRYEDPPSSIAFFDVSNRGRVDLEPERRRKRHWHVRARVMLSGSDIFTGDSSLLDESSDWWSKANRAESTALPETNRARGSASV